MLDLTTYQKLRREADAARRKANEASGALKQTLERLKAMGLKNVSEAENRKEKLDVEIAETERKMEEGIRNQHDLFRCCSDYIGLYSVLRQLIDFIDGRILFCDVWNFATSFPFVFVRVLVLLKIDDFDVAFSLYGVVPNKSGVLQTIRECFHIAIVIG